MDVLSTTNQVHTQTHTFFGRRAFPQGRAFRDDILQFVSPWFDSDQEDMTVRSGAKRASRRSSTLGFSPLPPIIASPVCTPPATVHLSSLDLSFESDEGLMHKDSKVKGDERRTPSNSSSLPFSLTWISTPPTPPRTPRRPFRRINRRPSAPLLSLSTSFPATLSLHASDISGSRKRCVSLPSTSPSEPVRKPSLAPAEDFQLVWAKRHRERRRTPLCAIIPVSGTGLAISERDDSPSTSCSRPLFHIATSQSSDNEDGEVQQLDTEDQERSSVPRCALLAKNRASGHSAEETPGSETVKDNVRRHHALKELLSTEVGYLMDLRILVNIYLPLIDAFTSRPTSPTSPFGRSHSTSFLHARSMTRSHVSSYAPFPVDGKPCPSFLPESHATSAISAKDKSKISRPLFSAVEVETLARNAAEILEVHELLVEELQWEVAPFGILMSPDGYEVPSESSLETSSASTGQVDDIIRAVAKTFTAKVSRFGSYEVFCSGHLEALAVIRKVQHEHPAEWEAFEEQAAFDISAAQDCHAQEDASSQTAGDHLPFRVIQSTFPSKTRTRSLPSDSHSPRYNAHTSRSQTSSSSGTDLGATSGTTITRTKNTTVSRLSLIDYLIKPIQRICKYPLLFSHLKSTEGSDSKHSLADATLSGMVWSDVNAAVESALQAMRHAARVVDEARRRQDLSIQSSQIVSRIALAPPMVVPSHLSGHPSPALTPMFLTSLGACLLAGSLDVIYYPAYTSTLKAKYFGAFLYMGGYLILVKVRKGKVYEPRHWFSIEKFELSDVAEEEALLPCSFRLSRKGHHFELAAACQREKEAWMSSLRESVTVSPSWVNEPVSSLRFHGEGEPVPRKMTHTPVGGMILPPTVEAIPDLSDTGDRNQSSLPDGLQNSNRESRLSLKVDATFRPESSHFQASPSRRSSTVSVKAIFSPLTSDPTTVTIQRSSPSARLQVDHGLQDVISKPCIAARSHASIHDMELFQAPKVAKSGISRSNSGLSMAGAMGAAAKNRLSRHESLRVPRRRSMVNSFGMFEELDARSSESKRNLGTTSLASILIAGTSTIPKSAADISQASANVHSDPSALPSQSSSRSTSDPSSTLVGPTPESVPLSRNGEGDPSKQLDRVLFESTSRLKRTRSMAESVRRLFRSRRASLDLPIADPNAGGLGLPEHSPPFPLGPGLFKRLTVRSRHRRVRSTSDVPNSILASQAQQQTPDSGHGAKLSYSDSGPGADPSAEPPLHINTPTQHLKRQSLCASTVYGPSSTDHPDTAAGSLQSKRSLLRHLKVIGMPET